MEEVKEESSQNCSDSEDSSSSQSSSTTEAENIESDLESLEEHYYSDLRRYTATLERDFSQHLNGQQLNNQEWNFHGGREGIQRFLTLPTTWPLARLMFPIWDLRRQMETLLQTYCFEIEVTCAQARTRCICETNDTPSCTVPSGISGRDHHRTFAKSSHAPGARLGG